MSDIHWKRAEDGKFNKPGAWKGGVVPGASDDAVLDASGAPYTVISDRTEVVDSLQLAANATLDVSAHQFTAAAGTGSDANAGTIEVDGGATLALGGTVDNAGLVSIDNAGSTDAASLALISDVTLTGGGVVALGGSLNSGIVGAGFTLTNVDNVISGEGTIGTYKTGLNLVNEAAGTIDASTPSAELIVYGGKNKGDALVNDGLMEATGAGGDLFIFRMAMSGSGGTIVAEAGAFVAFELCTVTGQSCQVQAGGGVSFADSKTTISSPIMNAGKFVVEDSPGLRTSSVVVDATMENDGTIILNGGRLTVQGAVTGSGSVLIYQGSLECDSSFDQNVVLADIYGRGVLVLGQSQSYGGQLQDFSLNRKGRITPGRSLLDLLDIGFVGAGEATFSGNKTAGVLTVTDGSHTARIHLTGDYRAVQFLASDDGRGGADIVVSSVGGSVPPHALVSAMAALGGGAAGHLTHIAEGYLAHSEPPLGRPRVMIA